MRLAALLRFPAPAEVRAMLHAIKMDNMARGKAILASNPSAAGMGGLAAIPVKEVDPEEPVNFARNAQTSR